MSQRQASILIIDDESGPRETLACQLLQEGFEVTAVESGMAAIQELKSRKFDIAITDLKMPGMDGVKTLAALKKIDPEIQVIVITGYATVETVLACMKLGAYDYIQKPLNIVELQALLDRALEKRHLQGIVALYEASRALITILKYEDLVKLVIELAEKVLRADAVGLFLRPEYRADFEIYRSSGPHPPSESLICMLANRGIVTEGDRISQSSLAAPDLDPYVKDEGFSSVLVYPLAARNTPFGALVLLRSHELPGFSPSELDQVTVFATQVSMALENARLYSALAAEKERLAVTLRSIGDGIITTDTDGKILLINKVAEALTGWSQVMAAGRSLMEVLQIADKKVLASYKNQVENVLKTGETFTDTNHMILVSRDGIERVITSSGAPILDKESRTLGVVLVFRDITEKLRIEKELELEQAARAAAELTEAKLEKSNLQLQALSTYILKAQEEERMRLARELHDELGQSLTSIKLALELALTTVDSADVNKTKRILNDLCAYAETTSKEVQRIARDLRPSVLDDFGLAAALEAYSQAYSKRTGIEVKLSLDRLSSKLTKEAETALYRIVQEALTNGAKHSGAKNISIDLVERSEGIILTVIDNGKGCTLDARPQAGQNGGFGLLGMAERARMVGGRILLKSQPGSGFCIQVILPIKEE